MSRTVKWAKIVGKHFQSDSFGCRGDQEELATSWDRPNLKEVPKVVHTMEDSVVEQSMTNAKTTAESTMARKGSDADDNVAGEADLDPKIAVSHGYYGEKALPWRQPAANPDREKNAQLLSLSTRHTMRGR